VSDRSIPAPAGSAISIAAPRSVGGRVKRAVDRSSTVVEAWLRAHTALVLIFL